MELPRLFYRLSELAEKWGKTKEDLLHMAAAGSLELSVNYYGEGVLKTTDRPQSVKVENQYIQIKPESVKKILLDPQRHVHRFMKGILNNQELFCIPDSKECTDKGIEKNAIHVQLNDGYFGIIVMPDEVARVEAEYPELIDSKPQQVQGEFPLVGWNEVKKYCKEQGWKHSEAEIRKAAKAAGVELDNLRQRTEKNQMAHHWQKHHIETIRKYLKK